MSEQAQQARTNQQATAGRSRGSKATNHYHHERIGRPLRCPCATPGRTTTITPRSRNEERASVTSSRQTPENLVVPESNETKARGECLRDRKPNQRDVPGPQQARCANGSSNSQGTPRTVSEFVSDETVLAQHRHKVLNATPAVKVSTANLEEN